VAVHGKFTAGTIERVAKMAGKQTIKVGNNLWFDAGDGNAIGLKNGVMLAGTTNLVKDRIADTWKAPALTASTNLGTASDALGGRPVFALVVGLSQTARTEALRELDGQNFLSDAIKRHKVWSFSVYKDGIGWTWTDSNKAGLESMAQICDGTIEILRAAQIAPRGMAKIVLGALDSYKGTSKQIDELIRRKGDIMKIVETNTGDGQFKAQLDKDPKTLKLSVRLTGKTLSEEVPAGWLLPLGGLAAVFMLRSSDMSEAPASVRTAPVPPPLPPPGKKQGNAPKRP
jgi:hypothetical protein